MAALVWMVVWVGFEPASLPDVCAGLVREVRDPEYRAPGERRRARQLELDLGEPAGGAL